MLKFRSSLSLALMFGFFLQSAQVLGQRFPQPDMPPGSYRKSCHNCWIVEMRGVERLHCRCNKIPFYFSSQKSKSSSLRLPCGDRKSLNRQDWDIANNDGRLVCKAPPPTLLAPVLASAVAFGIIWSISLILSL